MTRSHTMAHPRRTDPTRVTAQPALTTSDGREWLLVGAALAAISLAVLLPLSGMHAGVALTGAGIVLLILIAMGVVRAAVPARRPRLIALAALLGGMALVALGAVLVVTATSFH